ncbi:hypothetical protein [Bifidobacterium sp. SO1]|uniref:hypothetical protein n=1 Tax=Bifidobacterium sp. SO1 TaxID=2809029 RepID=UPI001BDC3FD0|nr:hypothetical protein [Bifidobacterium sp. SO1]MBT1161234.1 hypothetical protein [Bifidobacterium sp. SO1]
MFVYFDSGSVLLVLPFAKKMFLCDTRNDLTYGTGIRVEVRSVALVMNDLAKRGYESDFSVPQIEMMSKRIRKAVDLLTEAA